MLKSVKVAMLGSAIVMLSACGENPLSNAFKNVSIKNLDQDGNAIVELKTEVGSSNVVFSAGTLPIVDPKTGKSLGSISMERTLDGKNILTLTANVTGIKLGNVLTDNKLPNGNNVPVAGLTSLLAVPAGKHSRVYIGESGDKMMVGVAVAIEQFDNLASYIPGASVFFNIGAESGVNGVAGFFTSKDSGKSGLAIFAQTNVPAVGLPMPAIVPAGLASITRSSGVSAKALVAASTVESTQMQFVTRKASNEQANYFGYFVNQWGRSKTKLKVK